MRTKVEHHKQLNIRMTLASALSILYISNRAPEDDKAEEILLIYARGQRTLLLLLDKAHKHTHELSYVLFMMNCLMKGRKCQFTLSDIIHNHIAFMCSCSHSSMHSVADLLEVFPKETTYSNIKRNARCTHCRQRLGQCRILYVSGSHIAMAGGNQRNLKITNSVT